jgi:hypothetical protein
VFPSAYAWKCTLQWSNREKEREKTKREDKESERKQALVMPFAMLKVVHEEKFNFNEFFMT